MLKKSEPFYLHFTNIERQKGKKIVQRNKVLIINTYSFNGYSLFVVAYS